MPNGLLGEAGFHSAASEEVAQSVTTLLVLLLGAISLPSHPRLPPVASASLIGSITELVHIYPLGDTKGALENWVMSFSMNASSMELGGGLDDILGPGADLDITLGLKDLRVEGEAQGEGASPSENIPIEEDLVAPTAIIRSLVRLQTSIRSRANGSSILS